MSPTTTTEQPSQSQSQPQQLLPKSIYDQYKDGRYSDFVEQNSEFYHYYLHYSFFQALDDHHHHRDGQLSNMRVLDLGCGNGILSRKIWQQERQQKLKSPPPTSAPDLTIIIVALDKMDSMLQKGYDLCKKEGIPCSLLLNNHARGGDGGNNNNEDGITGGGGGIFFRQADLLTLDQCYPTEDTNNNNNNISLLTPQQQQSCCCFDLTMSGFLLAHLTTLIELETVLKLAFDALKPGGLSLHIIPGTPLPSVAEEEQQKEGKTFRVELPLHDKQPIILYDVHWNESTYIQVMEKVGFINVTIEELQFHPDTTPKWKEENGYPSGYKLLKGTKSKTS